MIYGRVFCFSSTDSRIPAADCGANRPDRWRSAPYPTHSLSTLLLPVGAGYVCLCRSVSLFTGVEPCLFVAVIRTYAVFFGRGIRTRNSANADNQLLPYPLPFPCVSTVFVPDDVISRGLGQTSDSSSLKSRPTAKRVAVWFRSFYRHLPASPWGRAEPSNTGGHRLYQSLC